MRLARVLEEAGSVVPERLDAFLLWAAGAGVVRDPRDRSGLHPLLIPVAEQEGGTTLGLLRWPTPPASMPIPVVRAGSHGMTLVACSIDQLLHQELALRDVDGEALGALATAAERAGPLYSPGMVAASAMPLKAYLLLKVGGLPELYQDLALAHEARGDLTSALITLERAAAIAEGWGQAGALQATLLAKHGRHQAAKQAAAGALVHPVWTLGTDWRAVAAIAGWSEPITAAPWKAMADNPDKPVLDRAAHRMDHVAATGGDWDALRPELAALFAQAELTQLAKFVEG